MLTLTVLLLIFCTHFILSCFHSYFNSIIFIFIAKYMPITICLFTLLAFLSSEYSLVINYDYSSTTWNADQAGKIPTPLTATLATQSNNLAYFPPGSSLVTTTNIGWSDSDELSFYAVIYITSNTGDILLMDWGVIL